MLKSSLKSSNEKQMSALGKYMPCLAATHSTLNGGKPRSCDAQAYENCCAVAYFMTPLTCGPVNLRNESFGNGALNDEVYGSNCGRCPVFIHDLPYSP